MRYIDTFSVALPKGDKVSEGCLPKATFTAERKTKKQQQLVCPDERDGRSAQIVTHQKGRLVYAVLSTTF